MTDTRLTALVQSLPATVPFVGPETQERTRNAPFRARLGANENVFGPSPKAIEAMAKSAADIWQYGDPENYDLRHALAEHHAIDPDKIVVGEGIDGLLGYLVRLFVTAGDAVVTSFGAYPTLNYHASGFGAVIHTVPYKNDYEDIDALISKAHDVNAKLIYIANPDNPMGSWHDGQTLRRALEKIPAGALLILDEAYIECAPTGTSPEIDINDPRLLRMRTFSKAYGLAGARVGYAMGAPDLISAFNKVRNHFGMNRCAQIGALAALEDQDWLTQTVAQISQSRQRITDIAHANDLTPLASATNFVTIDCRRDGIFAKNVLGHLTEQGVFIRMPLVAPQNRCIRISCGNLEDLNIFADALPKALRSAI